MVPTHRTQPTHPTRLCQANLALPDLKLRHTALSSLMVTLRETPPQPAAPSHGCWAAPRVAHHRLGLTVTFTKDSLVSYLSYLDLLDDSAQDNRRACDGDPQQYGEGQRLRRSSEDSDQSSAALANEWS